MTPPRRNTYAAHGRAGYESSVENGTPPHTVLDLHTLLKLTLTDHPRLLSVSAFHFNQGTIEFSEAFEPAVPQVQHMTLHRKASALPPGSTPGHETPHST